MSRSTIGGRGRHPAVVATRAGCCAAAVVAASLRSLSASPRQPVLLAFWGTSMTVPVPWTLGEPGCGAACQSGPGGSFRSCEHRPTHAGVKLHRSPIRRQLECWLVFACTEHVDQIDAARLLLPRDDTVRQ